MASDTLMPARRNLVILTGRLVVDPELRMTKNKKSVCQIRMAHSEPMIGVTNPDGTRKEKTVFVNVKVWGKQAESSAQRLKKGSMVDVTGRLEYEEWTTKDGQRRQEISIKADHIQFLTRQARTSTAPI